MLKSHRDTEELYITFLAWDKVLHQTYPTVFDAYSNYQKANEAITLAESDYRDIESQERQLNQVEKGYLAIRDFFELTEATLHFSSGVSDKKIDLADQKKVLDEEIQKNRSVLEASIIEIRKNRFEVEEIGAYQEIVKNSQTEAFSSLGITNDIPKCGNEALIIPKYIINLACQGHSKTSRINTQYGLDFAKKLYDILAENEKKFKNEAGAENFTALGGLIVRDIFLSYLTRQTKETYKSDPNYSSILKLVVKETGSVDIDDYIRKPQATGGNNFGDTKVQNPHKQEKKKSGIGFLILAAAVIIGIIFFVKNGGVGRNSYPSEKEISAALQEGDTVFDLTGVELDNTKAILNKDMNDQEKYQEIFDLIWKARTDYIKEYGKSKADHSAFEYTVCTPAWNTKEKYIKITGYDGSKTSLSSEYISIPDDIDGIPVMEIGNHAFENNREIKNVRLHWGIVSLGTGAFLDCKNLETIDNADYVMDIGHFCFDQCDNLRNLSLGEFIGIRNVGASAFRGCKNLEGIDLGGKTVFENVEIGSEAFSGATSLEYVTLPENVTTIGREAFKYDEKLKKIVERNEYISTSTSEYVEGFEDAVYLNCDKIDSETFYGCSSIPKLVLGERVQEIGPRAFDECTSLTEVNLNQVKVGDGNTILEFAFYKTGLTEVVVPGSYTYIGMRAFSDNSSLTTFKLMNSDGGVAQYLDGSALKGDEALTEAYISVNCADMRNWKSEGKTAILGATVYSNNTELYELYRELLGTSTEFTLLEWNE